MKNKEKILKVGVCIDNNVYNTFYEEISSGGKGSFKRFKNLVDEFHYLLMNKRNYTYSVDTRQQAIWEEFISKVIQGGLKKFKNQFTNNGDNNELINKIQTIKELSNHNFLKGINYKTIPFSFNCNLKDINFPLLLTENVKDDFKDDGLMSIFSTLYHNSKQERVLPTNRTATVYTILLNSVGLTFDDTKHHCEFLYALKGGWENLTFLNKIKNSLIDCALNAYVNNNHLLTIICLTTFWESIQEDICKGVYTVDDKTQLRETPSLKGEEIRQAINTLFKNYLDCDDIDYVVSYLIGYYLDNINGEGLNLRNYVAHGDLDNLTVNSEVYGKVFLYLTIYFLNSQIVLSKLND